MRGEVDFERLVREHHAALFRFALSMTRHEADAVDLVQDTFLRWAEKGHQLQDVAKAKAWLFTTLYREANARRRRVLRFPHEPIEDLETELPPVDCAAPRVADGALALAALDRLDPLYRAAVALFYLEDHSYPEIAGILEVPIGTVKSRVARGLAQMSQWLKEREPTATTPRPS